MVQNALEQADLLYFSTYNTKVWEYGLSLNKMIDYMKAGKPIIASYSGFPSMINESGCGEFVPAFDTKALIDVILKYKGLSQEELKTIGEKGQQWVLKERNYTRLAKTYAEVIANLERPSKALIKS